MLRLGDYSRLLDVDLAILSLGKTVGLADCAKKQSYGFHSAQTGEFYRS
ncbi:hypothetical protein DSUL_50078 [Desulfovibrionales bacterium]